MATGVVSECGCVGDKVWVHAESGGVGRCGFVAGQSDLAELGRAKLRYLAAYWQCCAGVASKAAETVDVQAVVVGSTGVAETRGGVQTSIECFVRGESDRVVESDAPCGSVSSVGSGCAEVVCGGKSVSGTGGLCGSFPSTGWHRVSDALGQSGVEYSSRLQENSLCSQRGIRVGGGIHGSCTKVGAEDVVGQASVSVDCGSGDGLRRCGDIVNAGKVKLGPNGGVSQGRGPNYERNCASRLAKKNRKNSVLVADVTKGAGVSGNKRELVLSELEEVEVGRKIAEARLAKQRAEYNFRRNEYLQNSRVSEQRWETERLTSDEKLRRISEARLGASPGFAKTIVEEGLASPSVPSLSDGTVSPNSSISVEEVQKMNRTIEKQAVAVVELQKKLDKFVEMFGDEGETVDDIIYPEQRKRDSTPQEPTHKVMWGECVPLKGRYKFQADHYQNGNPVIAIDGEIVEVDWRGEPFEYCGRDVLYVTPSMDGHIDE